MQEQNKIIDCYNKTAKNYAAKYIDELKDKHLDRILLASFAKENAGKGKLIDIGCGPGQATKYLAGCGITDITGIDIAPAMVETAKGINPLLHFETGDVLNLKYADKTFGSAIALYSIVHFDHAEIKIAFEEIKRVLVDGGQLLLSFHVGTDVIHLDDFLDHTVDIDFYFFETKKIIALLTAAGFEIIDALERQPYAAVEYPSQRAYIQAKAVSQ